MVVDRWEGAKSSLGFQTLWAGLSSTGWRLSGANPSLCGRSGSWEPPDFTSSPSESTSFNSSMKWWYCSVLPNTNTNGQTVTQVTRSLGYATVDFSVFLSAICYCVFRSAFFYFYSVWQHHTSSTIPRNTSLESSKVWVPGTVKKKPLWIKYAWVNIYPNSNFTHP